MAQIFSWQATAGDFAGWATSADSSSFTSPPNKVGGGIAQMIAGWGCDGTTPALTCAIGELQRGFLDPAGDDLLTGVTFKWQQAFLKVGSGAKDFRLLEAADTSIDPCTPPPFARSSVGGSVNVQLLGYQDGRVELTISERITAPPGTQTVTVASAAGVIPLDGTLHGYQLSLNFPDDSTLEYAVAIDNTTVISGTLNAELPWIQTTRPPCLPDPPVTVVRAGVTQFGVASRFDLGGSTRIYSSLVEVLVEDVAAIGSYLPCSATTLTALACSPFVPPSPPVVVVDDMTINCGTKQITIYGENFDPSATVQLFGPNGVEMAITVISITSTQIVIEVPDFVTGTYTVVVTNP